jgi:cytochrome c oxidase assembly protein subunit 15
VRWLSGVVIVLGGITVIMELPPLITTVHFMAGLAVFLLVGYMTIFDGEKRPPGFSAKGYAGLFLGLGLLIFFQATLGAYVRHSGAGAACPDFPTCQASFWPSMDFRDAFVVWRGLGIDYEGGVLDHPARVAIHHTHRIGALVAALALGFVAWRAVRGTRRATRIAGIVLGVVLVTQLVLGPAMVLARLPLPLATAHNAVRRHAARHGACCAASPAGSRTRGESRPRRRTPDVIRSPLSCPAASASWRDYRARQAQGRC